MLKTTVKANSVSNLTDARYFAAWHVDWLGFDLTANGLAILPLPAVKEIKDWIEGPKIIGELDMIDVVQSQQIIDFLSLDHIQVGMHTPVEYLNGLNVTSILKEVIIEPTTSFETLKTHLDQYFEVVDRFLLNFDKNGIDWENEIIKGKTITTSQLQQLCTQYDILLSMDFTADNTANILQALQPLGISVSGGNEEKVGFKSFDELDEVFELLEEEI